MHAKNAEMDNVTQQNAALVEEASAAAQAMQDQAASLSQAVSVFKLDGMQRSTAAPAVRPVPKAAVAPIARKRAPAKLTGDAQQPRKIVNAAPNGEHWEEF